MSQAHKWKQNTNNNVLMYFTTAVFCPKATSATKPKPGTLGKGTSYQATKTLGEKKWPVLGHTNPPPHLQQKLQALR